MKLSNRVLWLLLLFSIIGAFYIFYQVFFKIKLTSLEINSNIWAFSWTIENIKFSKNFYCKEKKCSIKEIPPFDYKIVINKKNYKRSVYNLDLSKKNKLDIFLEKEITVNPVSKEDISLREKIISENKNKLEFSWRNIKYNKIIWNDDLVYFVQNNKLYFYNLKNNNSFLINFKPNINYIKILENNNLLINTYVWSFIFNVLNKDLEYFSLFSDFVILKDWNYIWVINNNDEIRKKNFDLNKGNFLLNYNPKTKEKYILKTFDLKINKIYILNNKIYIENGEWAKFEIIWYSA